MSKPFCKVCFDAKKSEFEFNSHYPKHFNTVVCPTLLSIKCKYCKQSGHTINYCIMYKKYIKGIEKDQRKQAFISQAAKPKAELSKNKKSKNVFDCFDDESSEEEPEKVVKAKKVSVVRMAPWAIKPLEKPKMKCWADEDSDDE